MDSQKLTANRTFVFPLIDYEKSDDRDLKFVPLQRGREYTIDARSFSSCDTLEEALAVVPNTTASQTAFDDDAVCSDCRSITAVPYDDNRFLSNKFQLLWKHNWKKLEESADAGCMSCCCIKVQLEFEAQRASGMSIPRSAPIMISSAEQGQFVPTRRDACGSIMIWYDYRFYSNHFINPIWLTCFTYSDDAAAADPGIVCRQPASHAGSEQCLQWMKQQMEVCESSHVSCSVTKDPLLPTRVVHVGSEIANMPPRLIVSDGMRGRYIGLSHCWGQRQPFFKLTSENLVPFQREIVLNTLPKNFRDAIGIARKLEIDYIWIDALCIVQDDINDWAAEAPKMASIYSQATLTVVTSGAESCHDGFLCPRPAKDYNEFRLPYVSQYTTRSGFAYFKSEQTVDDQLDLHISQPLQSRGWCLQERLLSTKTVHFDANQLVWQCRKNVLLESRIEAIPSFRLERTSRHVENRLKGLSLLKKPSTTSLAEPVTEQAQLSTLGAWYRIVDIYAAKLLTSSADVLPAFAGLATHFETLLQTRYLAGLWECCIIAQLLWSMRQLANHRLSDSDITRLESTYAPSWSWASRISVCDGIQVSFHSDQDFASPSSDRRFMSKYVSCDLAPRFPNAGTKGQMNSARLVLEGPTKPVSILHGVDSVLGGPHVCCTSAKESAIDKDWHQWIADLDPDFQFECSRQCTWKGGPILSASTLHDCGQPNDTVLLLLEVGRNWRGLVLQAIRSTPRESAGESRSKSRLWRKFIGSRARSSSRGRASTTTMPVHHVYRRVGVFNHQPRAEHRLPGNSKESSHHAMHEWDTRQVILV